MAVTATPIFTQTPKRGFGTVATAQTALDSPGTNQITIVTAGTNGSKVFEITVQAQATMAAGVVNIFVASNAGGATAGHLVDQFLVTVVASSATAVAYRLSRQYSNMILAASDLLIATTTITQSLGVTAWYADY